MASYMLYALLKRYEAPIQTRHMSMMKGRGMDNLGTRKRKQEKLFVILQEPDKLVDETSVFKVKANNVADSEKVKLYLGRLHTQENKCVSACIKVILSDSEVYLFELELNLLKAEFDLSIVSISQASPSHVDRVLSLHGNLSSVLRCAMYISYLTNSKFKSNGSRAFTLKSLNYVLKFLLEKIHMSSVAALKKIPECALEVSNYENNTGLKLVQLTGDFSSIFKGLLLIFRGVDHEKCAPDDDIEMLPIIKTHEIESIGSPNADVERKISELNSEASKFLYKYSQFTI